MTVADQAEGRKDALVIVWMLLKTKLCFGVSFRAFDRLVIVEFPRSVNHPLNFMRQVVSYQEEKY